MWEEKSCHDFNLELAYHVVAAFRHLVPVTLSTGYRRMDWEPCRLWSHLLTVNTVFCLVSSWRLTSASCYRETLHTFVLKPNINKGLFNS